MNQKTYQVGKQMTMGVQLLAGRGIRSPAHGSDEQYLFELRMGVAFALYILGPLPPWAELKVISASQDEGESPAIAVEFDLTTRDLHDLDDYVKAAEKTFEMLDEAVNWHMLSRPEVLKRLKLSREETTKSDLGSKTSSRLDEATVGYHLFEGCGIRSREHGGDEQYAFELRLGLEFVRHIFGEPPEGAQLDLIWAQYNTDRFPVIAVGFVKEPPGLKVYEQHAEEVLDLLDRAIDWSKVERASILDRLYPQRG